MNSFDIRRLEYLISGNIKNISDRSAYYIIPTKLELLYNVNESRFGGNC